MQHSTPSFLTDSQSHDPRYSPTICKKGDEPSPSAAKASDYDVMRRRVQHLRVTAPEEYYGAILEIARLEIRAVENAASGSPRSIP